MKSKNWQEMKNLSEVELQAKLRSTEEEVFRLKFRHATTPLKNGIKIRELRRNIARLKTLLNEKTASKEEKNK
jgi:large subunit ribosomal protein L29